MRETKKLHTYTIWINTRKDPDNIWWFRHGVWLPTKLQLPHNMRALCCKWQIVVFQGWNLSLPALCTFFVFKHNAQSTNCTCTLPKAKGECKRWRNGWCWLVPFRDMVDQICNTRNRVFLGIYLNTYMPKNKKK